MLTFDQTVRFSLLKTFVGKGQDIGKTDHMLHDVKLTTSRILFAAMDLKGHAVVLCLSL